MPAPKIISDLVERFRLHKDAYQASSYNETQVRREFIDPFFKALGWDIDNEQGYAEAYKDVVHEDALKIGGNTKAPDYAFRIGGTRKFFLEAKKPSVNIKQDVGPAFQIRRYAWSAKLSLSILTDFEEFAVYDCRVKPEKNDRASIARTAYFTFEDYIDKWDEIAEIFSREAVLKGSFDKYAADNRRKRGTAEVDDAFLAEIENWRSMLAKNIALRNRQLDVRELNAAVQRIIDRIVFLRIAEDRGIEKYGQLQSIADKKGIYEGLTALFRKADDRYNSGLFHFKKGDGSPETLDTFTLDLEIDDKVLKPVIKKLYYPESPYEFSVLPADILGQVYERFLGKVIRLSGSRATIEEKPEVKKAGGVYYTPSYVVNHIVAKTLEPLLAGRTPAQASGQDGRVKNAAPLRVVDPACGSGSFLIGAYQFLLDWYRDAYVSEGPQKHLGGKDPKLLEVGEDDWRLTIAERRRILLAHIYGVDIDPQAVEVTKLSLLLKVLEGETADAMARQMDLFRIRALPDLGENIKCGNSLIGPDFYQQISSDLFGEEDLYRINSFDWKSEFPFFKTEGGFGAVIGNPPWVSLTGKFGNDILSNEEQEHLIRKFDGNTYMPNMYEYFISMGLTITKDGGRFSFIVPDRFGKNDQFLGLRQKILKNVALGEVLYRAPFPGVTADTLIFGIENSKPSSREETLIGDYTGHRRSIPQASLLNGANRFRFEDLDALALGKALVRLEASGTAKPLGQLIQTTSGFGGKSTMITNARQNAKQIEVLKGASISKFRVGNPLYFDFNKKNITGRTTDKAKLGWSPKVLIRKTGSRLIAAFDESGTFPEQSLYFTFGDSSINEHYLLALLNSRLIGYIFAERMLTNQDSIAQVKKVDLDALPIVMEDQIGDGKNRVDLVAEAARSICSSLAAHDGAKSEQVRAVHRRTIKASLKNIDQHIYDLYALTPEERAEVDDWDGHLELSF
ncbi:Eco57I restriction-modification methylase domain-containing protein [Qipengyuania nanhaisediminis]|uniref:site-specific DNA-methyltransferase (adenine-specific) n=1 Tax=Qipengyuania nanhaisediminis TaxID=604088 RepID=A0A1I5QAW2_9SPHN|nr:TaqI-like C-terminal specificity domain-containing protein [Qipengyuania nanhaisediminis]SFP43444.1 Methyltransferase domain-containing protein [Qipengyuania nanhaisediminis]